MYYNKNLYACVNCSDMCLCLCVCVYMCCVYMSYELFVYDYQEYFSFIVVSINSDFNYQCIIALMHLMVSILAKP